MIIDKNDASTELECKWPMAFLTLRSLMKA